MPAVIDVTRLTDDDLRAAVEEAWTRLPHHEVCEHCEDPQPALQAAAARYRAILASFNERAAVAGYLIPSNKTLVHRWDCPSMQAYLREIEASINSGNYEDSLEHGCDLPYPTIATGDQARAFVNSSKARRGCKTCSPDL